jgi:hypothetical protein
LLLARIAEAWWKLDSKRARLWMDSAVGDLEFQPQNESLADARKRIATAETVTTIALPLDRSYADRLLNVVSEGIERAAKNVSTKEDRTELSHLTMKLTDIGRVAARAKEFAASDRVYRTLLKLKDGNNLQSLFISLRQSDPAHADKLFGEALEVTRTEYDPLLLFGLAQLAYPDLEREPWMLPAEDLRRRFLDLFSDAFVRVPQDEEEQTKICHLQFDAGRLISKYPPDRLGAMQSVLDDCKHRQPVSKIEATMVEKKLESTDDFLKAAEAGEDARDRALYKVRAAQKAHEAKDFVRALEIVNSLTEDEREAHPAWVSEHNSYEYDALLELYRRHDYLRCNE